VASRRDLVISFLLLAASPGWSFLLAPNVAAQSASTRESLEAEVITIRRNGFDPKQIRRAAGRFMVVVNNRSGLPEVSLRLERLAGSRLRDVRIDRKKLDWNSVLDLTPGTYKLTEARHPTWACEITITPRQD
jgi:hypothetical protein